jgi:uncharacterized phage-associated protein
MVRKIKKLNYFCETVIYTMDYKKNIINEALKNFKNGPLYEALIKEKKYIELFKENLKKSKNML